MEKLTVAQIFELVREGTGSDLDYVRSEVYNKEKYGEIDYDHWSGGEGEGENHRIAFHFKDHGVWMELAGNYQSHNGVDYYGSFEDSFYEVFPCVTLKEEYSTTAPDKDYYNTLINKLQALIV